MARAFRRRGRGEHVRYVATLDADERQVVGGLMNQVRDLLEPPEAVGTGDDGFDEIVAGLTLGGDAPDRTEPEEERDPALDRLLPSASRDDEAAAAEFRRLTEGGLRHRKAVALAASVAVLEVEDHVDLDPGQAHQFLTALTDVRLVLGERLGLRDDTDLDTLEALVDGLDADQPLVQLVALYDFTTWLQETLASALLER
ncbi:DUF2017 domain-containing protein [Phycicoccus sp. CSK15P-2]|uniref:DUF2017 family protein n=1 Tax=Phycicoccus sp. CSK15P-2 TaxID=2807627 RepID=UPI00195056FF|nr:DUF2017 family protein [Phycicoccus sp. CSK15P-2]MBM6404326.1 DUF2017 domain-containing protein [Phycicoccus sp. CSK15P-2]